MRWVGAAWLCAASVDSLAQFHSTISGVHPGDGAKALDEALTLLALERGGEAAKPDLAFVCVGAPFEGAVVPVGGGDHAEEQQNWYPHFDRSIENS